MSIPIIKKVNIGIPVYNGEKSLRRALDSVLAQTFTDFNLIISDNASTDSTQDICLEYAAKDKRIIYIRQEKNIGPARNFNFVLQEANSKYFLWIAADDYIHPDFIKKTMEFLDKNKEFIGCISKVQTFQNDDLNVQIDTIDSAFQNFRYKVISTLRPGNTDTISGTYDQKIRKLFKKNMYRVMYSLFRTEELRRCIEDNSFVGFDVPLVLNILKRGDIKMLDEVLMYRFDHGISTRGSISVSRMYNSGLLSMIFPHYPVTVWCLKHLGIRRFFRNIDHFIELNLGSEFFLIMDFCRLVIKKIIRK